MEWLQVHPENDPPERIRPIPESAIFVGWRSSLGIDWRIDVLLARDEGATSRYALLPAVVVRPLLRLPLDIGRVSAAYREWEGRVVSANRLEVAALETPVPGVEELLMQPLTGPPRTCEVLTEDPSYWENHRVLLEQVHTVLNSDRPESEVPVEELLEDYPFVVAALDHPKRLWNPATPKVKPSMDDSVDRVIDPVPPSSRPRHYDVPHLAAELLRVLPDGRTSRSEERDQAAQVLGPLQSRWAYQTASQHHRDEPGNVEVARVGAWRNRLRGVDPGELAEIARRLAKYADNRKTFTRRGRALGNRLHAPRLVAPYLCPDLSVHMREVNHEDVQALLVHWVRSPAFHRMLHIVSGKSDSTIRCRSWDGSMPGLLSERHLPFHRMTVRFPTDHPDHRAAVAMVPSAQPDQDAEVDVTGFGDRDDVLTRWFGTANVDVTWHRRIPGRGNARK